MPEISPATLESLFGLIVHDLRNPAATLGANIGFVREVMDDPSVPPQELNEALSDAQQALTDLMRGLDQLAWIGRWANDHVAPSPVLSAGQLRSLLDRRGTLLSYIAALIDTYGERNVLTFP